MAYLVFPLPNRNTVNLAVPSFTLDVNQVPIRPPAKLPADLYGLCALEWNYFEHRNVELCVTPETEMEITQGTDVTSLGWAAYQRFKKSELYKRRPPDAILQLSQGTANQLWDDMRGVLWPSVKNLAPNQIADVNQIFYHAVSSGSTADNSIFVTRDDNFIRNATPLYQRYGVTVLRPNDAWKHYEQKHNLQTPSTGQLDTLWNDQQRLFLSLRSS